MTGSKRFRAAPAVALIGALALAACATGPDPESFGGRLITEGGEVSAIGTQWTKGEEMVAKGQEMADDGRDMVDDGEGLVSKGNDRISDGKSKISRGERMVAEGKRLMQEAEEKFRARQAATPPTS